MRIILLLVLVLALSYPGMAAKEGAVPQGEIFKNETGFYLESPVNITLQGEEGDRGKADKVNVYYLQDGIKHETGGQNLLRAGMSNESYLFKLDGISTDATWVKVQVANKSKISKLQAEWKPEK